MIDATVGGSVSNSYVTIEEADQYFTSRNHSSDWESVTDKDKFLITATNQVDWYFNFNGVRTSDTQALEFPRTECYDSKLDQYVASDEIPKKVKYAVFELVLASIDEDRFQDSDMTGLQEVQVGTLRIKSNSSGIWQDKKKPVPDIVVHVLSGLINNLNSSLFSRVVRF